MAAGDHVPAGGRVVRSERLAAGAAVGGAGDGPVTFTGVRGVVAARLPSATDEFPTAGAVIAAAVRTGSAAVAVKTQAGGHQGSPPILGGGEEEDEFGLG